MPELPEVETVARLIRPRLVGRTIEGLHVGWERTLGGASPRSVSRALRGARAAAVRRRGKYVIIDLERGEQRRRTEAGALVIHLRMTGRLHVDPLHEEVRPYTRVACRLDDGCELRFVDVRKFGRFRFARHPEELVGHLGPEPLEDTFTREWFHAGLLRRRRLLKPLLLDQSFVAGLGNIYVDESLHAARLHPLARSNEVGRRKADALWLAIRETLAAAIEREGSSFDTFYLTPEGQPGSYQERFQVYGRDGKPCLTCGRKILKLVVGQRGTHLCPRCQRPGRAVMLRG